MVFTSDYTLLYSISGFISSNPVIRKGTPLLIEACLIFCTDRKFSQVVAEIILVYLMDLNVSNFLPVE